MQNHHHQQQQQQQRHSHQPRRSPITTTTSTSTIPAAAPPPLLPRHRSNLPSPHASHPSSSSSSSLKPSPKDSIMPSLLPPSENPNPHPNSKSSRSPSFVSRSADGGDAVDPLPSWGSNKQAKIWPAGCSTGSSSSNSNSSSSSSSSGCSEQQELALNNKNNAPKAAARRDPVASGHGGGAMPLTVVADKRGFPHPTTSNGAALRREARSSSAALFNRGSRRGFQVIELQPRPRIVPSRHRHAADTVHGRPHRDHPMSASEQVVHLAHHHHHHHLQSYLHDRRRRRRPSASAAIAHASSLHSHDDRVIVPSSKHRLHNDPSRADPALMVPTTSTGNCFCVPRRGRASSAARRAARVGYGCNSERSFSPLDSDEETAPLMTEPEPYHDLSDGLTASSSMDLRSLENLQASARDGARRKEGEVGVTPQRRRGMAGHRSLSQKYRPKALKDMVGQGMVAESLQNAILRDKIAPVYLFQGPRGTGKTTAARIFTAAMNCLSVEELRPCGVCSECSSFAKGHNYDVKEVDAATNSDLDSIRFLLKHISLPPSTSRYKVFVVDSCNSLSPEAWSYLLKCLEEPPSYVVFILITSDPDHLPRTAVSRCQKFIFPRIKDADIAFRLRRLANDEGVDIDPEALQFIANRADGSFRDAENMLDQLSLLGTRITLATVQDMVGLIPDEKLSHLLRLALSGDSSSTVQAIRELVESGVEPLALTSQLANFITDILAGKTRGPASWASSTDLVTKDQNEERLKEALRILSESEKQLRSCSDRTTWLTAAFLQFNHNSEPALSRENSVRRSPANFTANKGERDVPESDSVSAIHAPVRTTEEMRPAQKLQAVDVQKQLSCLLVSHPSSDSRSPVSAKHAVMATKSGAVVGFGNVAQRSGSRVMSPSTMKNIWNDVIHSVCLDAVKQLLLEQGRLVSLSVTEASAIARIAFRHPEHKNIAEEARSNIANAFQLVLGFPTEVEIRFEKMHRDLHQMHGDGMGRVPHFDEFGHGVGGPVEGKDYSSGAEDMADDGGSSLLCWNNARRRSKGKHVRRRRRGRFLLRLVPCAKGGRVT